MNEKEKLIHYFGYMNALFYYNNEFLKLCEKPNNRDLENSKVMKKIQEIMAEDETFHLSLAENTPVFRARIFDISKLKSIENYKYGRVPKSPDKMAEKSV